MRDPLPSPPSPATPWAPQPTAPVPAVAPVEVAVAAVAVAVANRRVGPTRCGRRRFPPASSASSPAATQRKARVPARKWPQVVPPALRCCCYRPSRAPRPREPKQRACSPAVAWSAAPPWRLPAVPPARTPAHAGHPGQSWRSDRWWPSRPARRSPRPVLRWRERQSADYRSATARGWPSASGRRQLVNQPPRRSAASPHRSLHPAGRAGAAAFRATMPRGRYR